MKKTLIIYIITLSQLFLTIKAQDVTYNHDESVMNQFTVGEIGSGALTPSWYYELSHKDYMSTAYTLNKLTLRGKIQYSLVQETPYSEKADSALTERMKKEAENMLDRTPGLSDISWNTEEGKINSKKQALRDNIDRIVLSGGTSKQKEYYEMLYNCMECAIENIRDSYMPSAKREEEYLNIYKDLTNINHQVVTLLTACLAVEGSKKYKTENPLSRPDIKAIATSSHGRWKEKVIDVVNKRQ